MSDTPRTDAAAVSREFIEREMDRYTHKFVLADFARELERELAAAKEKIAEWEGDGIEKDAKIGALTQTITCPFCEQALLLSQERDSSELIERCAKAAEAAQLPPGYQWGDDAMEQFDFGKARTAHAIRTIKP